MADDLQARGCRCSNASFCLIHCACDVTSGSVERSSSLAYAISFTSQFGRAARIARTLSDMGNGSRRRGRIAFLGTRAGGVPVLIKWYLWSGNTGCGAGTPSVEREHRVWSGNTGPLSGLPKLEVPYILHLCVFSLDGDMVALLGMMETCDASVEGSSGSANPPSNHKKYAVLVMHFTYCYKNTGSGAGTSYRLYAGTSYRLYAGTSYRLYASTSYRLYAGTSYRLYSTQEGCPWE